MRQTIDRLISIPRHFRSLFSGGAAPVKDPVRHDAELSGWLNFDTGELIEGFPVTNNDVVLDFGCGDGDFSYFCAEQGAEIILADIDQARLDQAARLVATNTKMPRAVRAIHTNAEPLPLEDGAVSRVIAMEVLEHVDDPAKILSELVRVGRPGALYLITVPDPVAETVQLDFAPPSYFQKPNHIRILQRDEFELLVKNSGLIVERKTSHGFFWAMWWFFFWTCKRDLSEPWHPLLQSWAKTWGLFLETEQGPEFKKVLDKFMPKSQVIIARKPIK